MAICTWCNNEMTTGASCTVEAVHLRGTRLEVAPHRPPGRATRRCGDCGVKPGGFHHPGCDLQRCPRCAGQFISCGCRFDEDLFGGYDDEEGDFDDGVDWSDRLEPYGIDADGNPMGRGFVGGEEVIVHFADVPDSDLTVLNGIPCTTAVRTVIDCAPYSSPERIRAMVDDAVARRLFTLDELWCRLDQPDMHDRPSAEIVRRALSSRP